ncbi:MAG: hypothetical protein HGA67_00725 [Candidatus Yonathbacteria bacterium]|nr:hypothetical protein [Candidatus Yonathbacteria bacterium]
MSLKMYPVNLGAFFNGAKRSLKIGVAMTRDSKKIIAQLNQEKPMGLSVNMGTLKELPHGECHIAVNHKKNGMFITLHPSGNTTTLFLRKATDSALAGA